MGLFSTSSCSFEFSQFPRKVLHSLDGCKIVLGIGLITTISHYHNCALRDNFTKHFFRDSIVLILHPQLVVETVRIILIKLKYWKGEISFFFFFFLWITQFDKWSLVVSTFPEIWLFSQLWKTFVACERKKEKTEKRGKKFVGLGGAISSWSLDSGEESACLSSVRRDATVNPCAESCREFVLSRSYRPRTDSMDRWNGRFVHSRPGRLTRLLFVRIHRLAPDIFPRTTDNTPVIPHGTRGWERRSFAVQKPAEEEDRSGGVRLNFFLSFLSFFFFFFSRT